MKLKRFTSILLSGIMIAASLPAVTISTGAQSEYMITRKSEDGVYNYVVYDNKYAELTQFNGLPEDKRENTVYEIPSVVDGYEVRFLGSYLFDGCNSGYKSDSKREIKAEKFIIPDTVTYIGDNAFAGSYVPYGDGEDYGLYAEEFVLPSGLTYIGNEAFRGCKYLKKMNIPESIKEIGKFAFEGCVSLSKVTLPDSLETIPYGCFEDCISLKNIKFTHYMDIKGYAFYGCKKLKTLNVLGDTNIEKYAFGFYDYIPDNSGGNLGPAHKRIKGCRLNVSYNKGASFGMPVREYANYYGIKANIDFPSSTSKAGTEAGVCFNMLIDGKKGTDFKSSKPKILKITKNGKASALKQGKTVITAKLKSGKTVKIKMTVNYNPEISKRRAYGYYGAEKLTLRKGQTKKLYAFCKAVDVNLKFKNTKIAKFTSKKTSAVLKIKGLKKGNTTIKVRINGVWRKLKVKVK